MNIEKKYKYLALLVKVILNKCVKIKEWGDMILLIPKRSHNNVL